MNITIDDASPQIGYYDKNGNIGSWKVDHGDDGLLQFYTHKTFHSTTQDGDFMTFTFHGSAVYVFGAKRGNHGLYYGSIDGEMSGGLLDGHSSTDQIGVVLFSAQDLDPSSEHTVVITSKADASTPAPSAQNPAFLDIDQIVVTTSDTGEMFTTTYDDTSPAVKISQFRASATQPNYYNATDSSTDTLTASVSFSFKGTGAQFFGGLNTDHGNYTISVDDGAEQMFNGTSDVLLPQTSLFLVNNLEDGYHSIVMTNHATGGKTTGLDFDYVMAFSTSEPSSDGWGKTVTTTLPVPEVPSSSPSSKTSSGSHSGKSGSGSPTAGGPQPGSTQGSNSDSDSSQSDSGSGSTQSNNTGAIVGGVVGALAILALASGLIWFFYFKRRRETRSQQRYRPAMDLTSESDKRPHEPEDDMTGEEVSPFVPASAQRGVNQFTSPPPTASAVSYNGPSTHSQVSYVGTQMSHPGSQEQSPTVAPTGFQPIAQPAANVYMNFPVASPSSPLYAPSASSYDAMSQADPDIHQTAPAPAPVQASGKLASRAGPVARSTEYEDEGQAGPAPPAYQ